MGSIKLIVEDEKTILVYKKLLKSKSNVDEKVLVLDNKKHKISDDIVLIDIKTHKGLDYLDNITFKSDSFIIIISPILQEFIKVSPKLKKQNLFYLTKPIDIVKLNGVINESEEKISKNNYLKSKENILIKTIEDSPFRVGIYDLEGKMLYANTPYIVENDIEDRNNSSFDELKKCQTVFKDIIYNLKVKEIYTIEKKEKNKWYKSFFYITKDEKSLVHLCMDETEDKVYLESLKKSAQFFEQSNEGVIITDKNGNIIVVNDSFCDITGYTKDEALGKSTRLLNSGTHDKGFYENMWASLKFYGKWQGEIWNKRKNGEIYPEWLSITKLLDPTTKELNYMAIFSDITSLKEADQKLHFYANYDPLTGLLNKVQFDNMLEQSINSAVRNNKHFALMFIDLDYFKDVNDTAGHNMGDLVLKEVGRRFQKTLRKEDIIARIGGDEFTVIVDHIKEESDAILLAEKLNEVIRKPFKFEEKVFYLSLSIGIAIYPFHGLNATELSKNADSAMYEVKKNGRDDVLLYNQSFTDNLMKKISLQVALKKAVKHEDFNLYYQPVVDMKTQKVIGAEALIRWEHPKLGFISPEEFIPVAEHHGFIEDIGKYVLKTACEDIPSLIKKFGEDFVLAVNVSSKEFANDTYVDDVLEMVNDFQVLPKNLELEITETYIMQNHSLSIEKMERLKLAGFKLAIDDFGTGYSSLNYLKKFPINKIKIDKSFVLDILEDEDDKDMVKAIINIAKIFELEVQAEGVETKEHVKLLKDNNADIAQGYFYSKPIPLDEVLSKDWSF